MKLAESLKIFFLCAFTTVSLFLSFFVNYWGVAEQAWFETYQHDSESYIIGRMVQSAQQGIFSAGGLPGFGSLDDIPVRAIDQPFADQYLAYMNHLSFGTYATTHSQIGGQGLLFSLLNNLITASPQHKLRLFYALTALLTAMIITAIIVWFYLEFGLLVAMFVLFSALFSQWLTVFARNLWWSLWSFYVPVVAMMYYIRTKPTLSTVQMFTIGIIVFVTVFVKCLITGYEYITTTLVMMVVPIVYYLMCARVNRQLALQCLALIGVSACLSILFSFGILCMQIAAVEGDVWAGVNHIVYSFQKRTHIEPIDWEVGDLPADFAPSLEANTITVVGKYFIGTYFDATNYLPASPFVAKYWLKIRYIYLFGLFVLVSIVLYYRLQRHGGAEAVKQRALLTTTWVSMLAPLSWFVIFKAHSYIHTHMNFIVWQMPFIFFGFACCGLVVKSFLPNLHPLHQTHRLS